MRVKLSDHLTAVQNYNTTVQHMLPCIEDATRGVKTLRRDGNPSSQKAGLASGDVQAVARKILEIQASSNQAIQTGSFYLGEWEGVPEEDPRRAGDSTKMMKISGVFVRGDVGLEFLPSSVQEYNKSEETDYIIADDELKILQAVQSNKSSILSGKRVQKTGSTLTSSKVDSLALTLMIQKGLVKLNLRSIDRPEMPDGLQVALEYMEPMNHELVATKSESFQQQYAQHLEERLITAESEYKNPSYNQLKGFAEFNADFEQTRAESVDILEKFLDATTAWEDALIESRKQTSYQAHLKNILCESYKTLQEHIREAKDLQSQLKDLEYTKNQLSSEFELLKKSQSRTSEELQGKIQDLQSAKEEIELLKTNHQTVLNDFEINLRLIESKKYEIEAQRTELKTSSDKEWQELQNQYTLNESELKKELEVLQKNNKEMKRQLQESESRYATSSQQVREFESTQEAHRIEEKNLRQQITVLQQAQEGSDRDLLQLKLECEKALQENQELKQRLSQHLRQSASEDALQLDTSGLLEHIRQLEGRIQTLQESSSTLLTKKEFSETESTIKNLHKTLVEQRERSTELTALASFITGFIAGIAMSVVVTPNEEPIDREELTKFFQNLGK